MTAREPDPDRATRLARLLGPAEPEISCERCFDELDRYVEAELDGPDPDGLVPGMHAHLNGCPACAEEHDGLLALVRLTPRR